jgi:hypothetical protein
MDKSKYLDLAKSFTHTHIKAGVIPSTGDVVDYLFEYFINSPEIEDLKSFQDLEAKIRAFSLDAEGVYHYENWQSYFDVVRSKGLISYSEKTISLPLSPELIKKTEFPLSAEGKYINPDEFSVEERKKHDWFIFNNILL